MTDRSRWWTTLVGLAALVFGAWATPGLAQDAEGVHDQPLDDRGQTMIEVNGTRYGAWPDRRGPIGGGAGYQHIVTNGDYRVDDRDELLEALSRAQAGETVFVEPSAEINLTVWVYIDSLFLEIPGGVTLASNRGHNGAPGALIYSDAFDTDPLIRTLGPDVRITGLRIRGPDRKRRMDLHQASFDEGRENRDLYYSFPTSDGIDGDHSRLQVDNCEIWGFSHAAIGADEGTEHHIHHNHIHHNQRHGLGYGVHVGSAQDVVIEYNYMDYNRHSIAGSGEGGYEARHNVVGPHANGHIFDQHRPGGTTTLIHHNVVRATHKTEYGEPPVPAPAVAIRGVPSDRAVIHHNWFHSTIRPLETPDGWSGEAIIQVFVDEWTNVEFHDNYYGPTAGP